MNMTDDPHRHRALDMFFEVKANGAIHCIRMRSDNSIATEVVYEKNGELRPYLPGLSTEQQNAWHHAVFLAGWNDE